MPAAVGARRECGSNQRRSREAFAGGFANGRLDLAARSSVLAGGLALARTGLLEDRGMCVVRDSPAATVARAADRTGERPAPSGNGRPVRSAGRPCASRRQQYAASPTRWLTILASKLCSCPPGLIHGITDAADGPPDRGDVMSCGWLCVEQWGRLEAHWQDGAGKTALPPPSYRRGFDEVRTNGSPRIPVAWRVRIRVSP